VVAAAKLLSPNNFSISALDKFALSKFSSALSKPTIAGLNSLFAYVVSLVSVPFNAVPATSALLNLGASVSIVPISYW
jgi:hypothetical protein